MPLPVADRVDPRCTRSRQRVLAAAVELLREEGLHGLTFEAVAARSGVAKTTIYRHFADREAMHLEAIRSVGPSIEMASTDDVVGDLTDYLVRMNRTLHDTPFGAILLSVYDAAERNGRLADLTRAIAASRRSIITARLTAAQRAHAIAEGGDLDLLCDQLVGPIFYRRFMSRQPMPSASVARLVRHVVTPLLRA